ncbi:hypothetical protein [Exiguobacterium antarcticum]|uniref:hypothetical protein n=1 Tax=Exiguobacterium antarcticum TaxID=132920 RepID=UPI003B8A66BB
MRIRELHINIKIRILINFLQKVTLIAIFPFMAIYFSNHFGLQASGILMIIVIVASLIASFHGGYLSDVKGRKVALFRGELLRFLSVIMMTVCQIKCNTSSVKTSYAVFQLRHFRGLPLIQASA